MAGKDKAPETLSVRLGNAHATSAGNGSPGEVVALPPDEAAALISAGCAVRVR
jgi:hypothetical protein